MIWNKHSNLEGLHAPFSASQSAWLRYDDEKLLSVYDNKKASYIGTQLHEWAKNTIDLKIRQPRSKKTLYAYVNDAIGFRMNTEVVLFYSDHFFGTADAISFDKGILRIHDLKTGNHPAKMDQLEVYTALFCLEYRLKPNELKDIELRIYQNDEVIIHKPDPDDISTIMDIIIHDDKLLEKRDEEELGRWMKLFKK